MKNFYIKPTTETNDISLRFAVMSGDAPGTSVTPANPQTGGLPGGGAPARTLYV
jgi:hypothetical protein